MILSLTIIGITHYYSSGPSGMPGAFTPTCTGEHLPGFIENSSRLAHSVSVRSLC